MVETDTSGVVALYTALIQGGATIFAVVGGFLLGFGPVRRTGWASAIREAERTAAESELRSAERARLCENAGGAHGGILRRLRQQILGAPSLRKVRLKQLEAEIEANERPIKELERLEAELDAQMDVTTDFYFTLQMLLILLAYCVVVPAWLLATLPSDPEPVRRGWYAVAAFAFALVYVATTVAEIGFRRGTDAGDRESRSQALRSLMAMRRGAEGILVVLGVLLLVMGRVSPPWEFIEGWNGGESSAPATPVGAAAAPVMK